MKIVLLDALTLGEDIDLSCFNTLGEVIKYDNSTPDEVPKRVADADVIIVNKVEVNEASVGAANNLKLVCETATGVNNLDLEFLESRNIAWRNVVGYSTNSVAQHTFALFFYVFEKLSYYDDYVKNGEYLASPIFTHLDEGFREISSMTWGIIGLGDIGRKVTNIARAFGARTIYYSPSGSPQQEGFEQVDFETLLRSSDVISVHAPLNAYTENLMDAKAFQRMKKTAIFLNVGRGQIVVEKDLKEALEQGEIAAAGLDVLCKEPMQKDNPLYEIEDSKRLFITPHIAWAGYEARMRVVDMTFEHIRQFFA